MSVATKVARATGKVARAKAEKKIIPPSSPYIGVDKEFKRPADLLDTMAKKKGGGGASRRGSHKMADSGGGCEVRYFYAHHMKLRKTGGNYYMDFGTLVHTGMAYHYAERMERKPQWYLEQPDRDVAMEIDSLGHPVWLKTAKEIMDAFKRYEAGDPLHAIYVEEEFETTVGTLDPDGEDEPAEEIEYINSKGEPSVLKLPTLNDEYVTCRPDLIVMKNGKNYIFDHKTAGGDRKGSGRLPVMNPETPDYTYYWQAMVNLWIVRQHIPVQGFIFNRVKRDIPYDFSQDPFEIPARQYAKVPSSIRAAIKRERHLMRKIARKEKLIAYPWECKQNYACTYARLCHVDTIDQRNDRIKGEFVQEED